MIEPMAAPVGFSVQAAQGTGLGPDAHQVVTGTDNADENAIPPAAPAGFGGPSGPVVSATAYTPQPKGDTNIPDSGEENATANNANSAYDEVDIFVPHVATVPPSGSPANAKGGKNDNDDDNDDKDDDQKPPATGGSTAGGSGGSSYEDLAARFEQLDK